MTRTLALFAVLLPFAMGCDEDYPPYVRLDSLRVLAIQSEPISPAAGETTTLTPLVYAPEGQVVSYAWSWCPLAGPANQGYPCLVSEAQLQSGQLAQLQGQPLAVPPYDLGNAPTASFPVTFDPERLRMFCRPNSLLAAPATDAGAGDAGAEDAGAVLPPDAGAPQGDGGGDEAAFGLDCSNGLPIQIKLTVSTATDRVDTVRALTLKLSGPQPANTNPVIDGLAATFRVPGGRPEDTFDVAFGPEGVTLPRQKQTVIKALVNAVHSEPFIDRDEMDQPIAANERLFLTWFVESGSMSPERTSYLPLRVPLADALKSKWTPGSLEDYPAEFSKLFVVIRDNRGGVGWASATARLVEAPRE